MTKHIIEANHGYTPVEFAVQPCTPQYLIDHLMERLKKGPAVFLFNKVDGTIRRAVGTLHSPLIEKLVGPQTPKTVDAGKPVKAPNPEIQTYFDLEAMAFRSFNLSNLVAIL